MANKVSFIKNSKWTNVPVFNNFIYCHNKNSGLKVYYKCSEKTCNAYLTLIDGQYSDNSGNHNHPSHRIEILKLKALNEMKQEVTKISISFIVKYIFI
jgi:hypothetical protein